MVRGYVQELSSVGRRLPQRRSFERRTTWIDAELVVHGRSQRIIIQDISRGGMKLKNAFGLMPGDTIGVELLSGRRLEGTVAWSVTPYTGVAFDEPLAEDDSLLEKRRSRGPN